MLTSIRALLHHYNARLSQLFRRLDDETLEMVSILPLFWKTWGFCVLVGYVAPPLAALPVPPGHAQNIAGSHLSAALADFWQTLLGPYLPLVTVFLLLLTVSALVGLLHECMILRLLSSWLGCMWWTWAGFLLMIHSPKHDAGGSYFVFALISAGTTILLALRWDRESEPLFISNLLHWRKRARKRRAEKTSELKMSLLRKVF